jgi:High potential iron-sulfur protein
MAVVENKDSCNNCLFFVENERMGSCRRFPTFVNKSHNDWCGEWRLEESKVIEMMVEQTIQPVEIRFVEPKKQRGRPKKS